MLSHFLRASNAPFTGNLSASYATTRQTNSTNTTHTLTSVGLGTPNKYRRVVVAVATVGTSSGDTINSVTVGGIALTKHIEDSGAIGVAIFSANIPSGTSATVVVTTSASSNIALSVFYLLGGTSSYSGSSAVNTNTQPSLTTSNLSVGTNDVAIWVATQQSANAVSETASVGTLTESTDVTFTASATRRYAAGFVTYNSSSSSASVTLTGDTAILKRIAIVTFTSP